MGDLQAFLGACHTLYNAALGFLLIKQTRAAATTAHRQRCDDLSLCVKAAGGLAFSSCGVGGGFACPLFAPGVGVGKGPCDDVYRG